MNAHPGPIHRNRLREQEFAIAEQLWREACWAYLAACFRGAPESILRPLGEHVIARRYQLDSSTP